MHTLIWTIRYLKIVLKNPCGLNHLFTEYMKQQNYLFYVSASTGYV